MQQKRRARIQIRAGKKKLSVMAYTLTAKILVTKASWIDQALWKNNNGSYHQVHSLRFIFTQSALQLLP